MDISAINTNDSLFATRMSESSRIAAEPPLSPSPSALVYNENQMGAGIVSISPRMVAEASTTKHIANQFFPKIQPAAEELDFNYVSNVWYLSTDPIGVAANVDFVYSAVIGKDPDVGLGHRFTSTFGLVTGPLAMMSAIKSLKAAQIIKDMEGATTQTVRIIRGGVECFAGGVVAAVRGVGLAASKPEAAKTILIANKILGYISTGVFSLLYALLAVQFSLDLVRGGKFLTDLNEKKQKGTAAAFDYLLDKIALNTKDLEEIKAALEKRSIDDEEMFNMANNAAMIQKEALTELTDQERAQVEGLIRERLDALGYEQGAPFAHNYNFAKGMSAAIQIVKRKQAEYSRRAGADSYGRVREVLKTGKAIDLDGKHVLIEQAKKGAYHKLLLNSLLVFTVIIGMASFIGSSVFTTGAPLIAAFVVMLVMNLLMTALDTYSFIESLRSMKKASKSDLATIALCVVLTLISFGVATTFAGGPTMRSVVLAIGAVTLAFQGGAGLYAYDKYKGRDRAALEEMKDDDDKMLDLSADDDEMLPYDPSQQIT